MDCKIAQGSSALLLEPSLFPMPKRERIATDCIGFELSKSKGGRSDGKHQIVLA